jgi:ribosome assembly protein YihI (activator of Der GTPase)
MSERYVPVSFSQRPAAPKPVLRQVEGPYSLVTRSDPNKDATVAKKRSIDKETDRGRHTVDPEEWCREAAAQLENRPGYEDEVPVVVNNEVTALTQKDILNALIAKRQEKNMTRGDVAKALRKNFSVVRSLESCEHDVLLSSLLSYAKAIGCRVEFRVVEE